MHNTLILIVLALCLGSMAASGETPLEQSRRIAEAKGDVSRDSLWWDGMLYREWIRDVNAIGDDNENLDEKIYFLADGGIRAHPEKIYFYNDIDYAIQLAVSSKKVLAFYTMDETCESCLFLLSGICVDPLIVERSRDFVNVYVRFPYYKKKIGNMGLMTSAPSVQFALPGLRRLRALSDPNGETLLEAFDLINKYVAGITPEEMLARPKHR